MSELFPLEGTRPLTAALPGGHRTHRIARQDEAQEAGRRGRMATRRHTRHFLRRHQSNRSKILPRSCRLKRDRNYLTAMHSHSPAAMMTSVVVDLSVVEPQPQASRPSAATDRDVSRAASRKSSGRRSRRAAAAAAAGGSGDAEEADGERGVSRQSSMQRSATGGRRDPMASS